MLSAVAWSPIAEPSTVMYPPSHGGCVMGWPGTPRSTLDAGTVVVGRVVVGAGANVVCATVVGACVVGGCVGGAVGGTNVGGTSVGATVGAGVVGASVAGAAVGAAVGGTIVVDGIGSGVVVGTAVETGPVDVGTEGTDSPGSAPSSPLPDAATTQTITPTRNTNTTPMTAGG
jgi:hypothetical protein